MYFLTMRIYLRILCLYCVQFLGIFVFIRQDFQNLYQQSVLTSTDFSFKDSNLCKTSQPYFVNNYRIELFSKVPQIQR